MTRVSRIGLGGVNCYLATAGRDFVLVDTGRPGERARLDGALAKLGCGPGNLRLVIVTHGDYEHAGNAAYLRKKYGARIAMHRYDLARVRRGDWDWGLKRRPDRSSPWLRMRALLTRSNHYEAFEPDICLEDGQSLLRFGCDATVLHLPGHTKGSIGILTYDNDLVCGDLLGNRRRPRLESFIDDMDSAEDSLKRLKAFNVEQVYPGHGRPFPFAAINGQKGNGSKG